MPSCIWAGVHQLTCLLQCAQTVALAIDQAWVGVPSQEVQQQGDQVVGVLGAAWVVLPLAGAPGLLVKALEGRLVVAWGQIQAAALVECHVALHLSCFALWQLETAVMTLSEQLRAASQQLAHPAGCPDHPVIMTAWLTLT